MTRTDRIMDLLDMLRTSEVLSVDTIAEALEVSRRTALRDLASLRDRGWPIRSEAGPGGGVYLDRDRGLRAVHLGLDEVVSLWLAAQLSKRAGMLPWNKSARSALNKVFDSVPQERQRHLRQLLRRVVISRPASAQVLAELKGPAPELLTAFEEAFSNNLCLSFDYTNRRGEASKRRAEPHGLIIEAPAWYLLSRDLESQQPRLFRMDRMRRVRVLTNHPFEPDFEVLRVQHEQSYNRS